MTYVRMLTDMQGSRHDNQPWPGYQKEIDVPEWEAKELVAARIAEYPDTPAKIRGYDVLKNPDPDYESSLKFADGGVIDNEDNGSDEVPSFLTDPVSASDDFDSDFEDDNDVTSQVKRPSTVDNKAAWIDYAVSKGADRERASAKTKAQLIADY